MRARKLSDYSGEFLPNLNFENFSHETMTKLLRLYAQLYIGIDGFWYFAVMERSGNEEALACDLRAWERGAKYEMKKITEALNIRGSDVVSLMKALQIAPWFQHMQSEIEIQNRNKATLAITYCPTLDALEKEGKGRHFQICRTVEPKVFKKYASFFNPKIEVEPLTPLPREKKDDVCCRWVFRLEG